MSGGNMTLERAFPTARLSDADEQVFAAARSVAEPPAAPESGEQAGVPKGTLTAGHHVGTGHLSQGHARLLGLCAEPI